MKINKGAANEQIILNQIGCGPFNVYGAAFAINIIKIAMVLRKSIDSILFFIILQKVQHY